MSSYAYEAVDASGLRVEGAIEVVSQSEALRRIKEMGLFPTRVAESHRTGRIRPAAKPKSLARFAALSLSGPVLIGRVKPAAIAVFTRQLATLVEAGMPLLRGLRILQQQEDSRVLKAVIGDLCASIEGGGSLSEALALHPKLFNPLYLNMVKAGEMGGALELSLRRLAGFMEKAQRIKGKVKSAMLYPASVMVVAAAMLMLMMIYVVPRFQQVFEGLLEGAAMPAFTAFILQISAIVRHHAAAAALVALALGAGCSVALRTTQGRRVFDRFKLKAPIFGRVFRKMAIARFARTLGTLLGSGVPILQALAIVKDAVGNVVVGGAISSVHDGVKQGDTLSAPLRASGIFPPMVAGMVDVGEQTGALPEMLTKIADHCDEEVDNAVNAMTSLLEPIMIVFLAVVVGSIVIALFLPILAIVNGPRGPSPEGTAFL